MRKTISSIAVPTGLYLIALVSGTSFAAEPPPSATPPSTTEQKSAEQIQATKERVADWLKTCLADWDQATHMTKNEWRTTCQRVAAERGRFLLDNPTTESVGKGGSRARQR
jgi:hypothetical protein